MFFTTLLLAIREIRRHLLRSFLTTLGIVIGVGAVITMVTLGNGATASVREQISSLGANVLMIRPGQGFGRGGGGVAPPPFDNSDLDAIRDQIAGVRAVAGQAQASTLAVRNAQNWQTTITGTGNGYFVAQSWALESGRYFSQEEEEAGKSVCIIGATVKQQLFSDVDPEGQRIRLGDVACDVIGVLEARGQGGFGADQDDIVVMPIKAVQRRFTGNRDIRAIMVSVEDDFDTQQVTRAISALLRERRHIAPQTPDDFNILDTRQIADAVSQSTATITAFLGAVAAVSLVVGGIGIMNIMLVSVTERTREIGIRLAIGALGKEVMLQFLVEAVVLSCLGGITGIVIALLASWGLAGALGLPFAFDPFINILSFVISALIGVVFGYFPARRAARLNPIDALRHE
ncbi:ABC transporter permease [Altericroceibacterium endophyticum]|uniref:FtsX-like permease family protein n=1 Tax=Altericroceibacterium endophyticum TaxID=1808508 RepID=A0A6I4T4Y9_9SPHN|nr:ABC transporter permease [Altericroceibacterium endophyticum]MXO65748.1 FtsX-like permease family protein [Altericroceibacterium endophyticum]